MNHYQFGNYGQESGLDKTQIESQTKHAFELLSQLVTLSKTEHLNPSSNQPMAWTARMFGQTETPQQQAIHACEREIIQLLESQPRYVDLEAWQCGRDQHQLLHIAAAHGFTDIVAALAKAGAPLDNPTHSGTPLMLAIHNRHRATITALLEAGVDVETIGGRQLRINQTLYGDRAVHEAARTDQPEVIAQLVAFGADVNAPNSTGSTALSATVLSSRREVAKMLLDLGANPNQPDKLGRRESPFSQANSLGSEHMLSLLLKYGANMMECIHYDQEVDEYILIQRHNATDSHGRNAAIINRWEEASKRWGAIEQTIATNTFEIRSLNAKDIVLCANIGQLQTILREITQKNGREHLGALMPKLPVWIRQEIMDCYPGMMITRTNPTSIAQPWTHKIATSPPASRDAS